MPQGGSTYIAPDVTIYGQLEIGKNCVIESGVIIGHPLLSVHNLEKYEEEIARINQAQTPSVVIGDDCIIRSGTVIYAGVTIGGRFDGGHHVLIRQGTRIGSDVYVFPGTQIHAFVSVGNRCRLNGFMANRSVLQDDVSMLGNLVHKYRVAKGGIIEPAPIIKAGATVGWNAIVIGNITVHEGAVVGAGAVVLEDVPAYAMAVGNPARIIRREAPASTPNHD